jgi:hypothetical protein
MAGASPEGWRAPYPRSWLDALTDWTAHRPIPEAAFYIVAGLAAAAILTLASWLGDAYPVGTLSPIHVLLGFAIGLYPWLIRRFNVGAARALGALDPLLTVDAEERDALEYRLTNLPFTPALVGGAVVAAISLARIATSPSLLDDLDFAREPVALAASLAVLVTFAFIGATIPLKFGYQAWLIHRITTRHIRIGLFEIARLYAFASLTGAMAAVLVVTGLVFYLAAPALVATYDPIGFSSLVIGVSLAASVFVLPLAGVHGRLVAEKERLRGIARESIAIATAELHRVVQANELPAMDPLNKAIASLDIEYRSINDAPTWPWRPDTFRWVIGVLMIPFAIFVLQQIVPRLLP